MCPPLGAILLPSSLLGRGAREIGEEQERTGHDLLVKGTRPVQSLTKTQSPARHLMALHVAPRNGAGGGCSYRNGRVTPFHKQSVNINVNVL